MDFLIYHQLELKWTVAPRASVMIAKVLRA